MLRIRTLLSLLPLLALATSQSLIPSTLPACASSCNALQTAATSCEATPASAQSCFCQSAYLTTAKTTPSDNLCAPTCSDTDWATIQAWYASTCASGGAASVSSAAAGVSSAAAAPQASKPATASSVSSAAGSQPSIQEANGPSGGSGPSGSGSGGSGGITLTDGSLGTTQTGQQWWDTHYQWIIMLIVLLIFFSVAGFGGAWWYRRRQRTKSRNMGAFAGGNAQQWAPNSSTHDFNEVADRQARGALASQGGQFGGAAMVERANSRKKGVAGALLSKARR